MKMSEEMAVRLHRMMWSDMQRELGNNPNVEERENYKTRWISKHFPGAMVHHSCFLCEFTQAPYASSQNCKNCPIKWPNDSCISEDAGANINYTSSPISEILALPARNKKLDGLEKNYLANDKETLAEWYYKYREELLSKASGRPASTAIEDHVKAIQKKAREEGYGTAKEYLTECSGLNQDEPIFDHVRAIQEKAMQQSTFSVMYCDAKTELAKASGCPEADGVASHIKAIQEKAVEDYFKQTPGAKLATMDVDQAFKQYADEQKAPIFHALAEASGLSAGNESVKAHINLIRNTAEQKGRCERSREVFRELAKTSGLPEGKWCISDHVKAIQEKAKEPTESLKTINAMLADKVNNYKDALSKESGLDRNRPVYDHIKKIHDDSFSFGEESERERIMDKIGEMLNDKPAGTCKDI